MVHCGSRSFGSKCYINSISVSIFGLIDDSEMGTVSHHLASTCLMHKVIHYWVVKNMSGPFDGGCLGIVEEFQCYLHGHNSYYGENC